MPLYEYQCQGCNQSFELLIRGGEAAECPTCHNRKLEKLLSVPAAHVADGASLPQANFTPCGRGGCGRPQCD